MMSKRYRIAIAVYLVIALALILTNSYLGYNGYTSNSKYHNLTYFQRRAVNVSQLTEIILSPFELLTLLLVKGGNLRDRESFDFLAMRLLALPFSFFLYFKSVRLLFFAKIKRITRS